jgi:hypothetical protein
VNRRGWVLAVVAALLLPAAAAAGEPLRARAFEVRHRPLTDAAELISSLLSPEGLVTLQPRLKTLVVQDREEVLQRVAALLADFDVPPRQAEVIVGLFLGSDSRAAAAGAIAPEALAREVRGVSETLGDFTKWTSYEPLGSRAVTGVEGARISARISDEYRVVFELESVQEAQGIVRFRTFTLERLLKLPEGGERAEEIYTTSIVLPAGQMLVVGAARGPDSRRALFLTLQARPR